MLVASIKQKYQSMGHSTLVYWNPYATARIFVFWWEKERMNILLPAS